MISFVSLVEMSKGDSVQSKAGKFVIIIFIGITFDF
jgi:hypothetical protein